MTSHDVVSRARRLLGIRRIGHTGTLDPGVAGVLVLLVGRATRLAELLQAEDKEYTAELYVGTRTDTQDAFGSILSSEPDCAIAKQRLSDVMAQFVGELQQVPPMTAAVRQGGRRLYELARQGVVVERPARQVFVDSLDVLRIVPNKSVLGHGSRVTFRVVCSKGTYVRTLCDDIGAALGCGAFMSFLLRTRVGNIDVNMTRTLDELEREAANGSVRLLPADAALQHIPRRSLTPPGARHVMHGRPVGSEHFAANEQANEQRSVALVVEPGARPRPGAELLRLYDESEQFLALAARDATDDERWQPRIVFRNERGDVGG